MPRHHTARSAAAAAAFLFLAVDAITHRRKSLTVTYLEYFLRGIGRGDAVGRAPFIAPLRLDARFLRLPGGRRSVPGISLISCLPGDCFLFTETARRITPLTAGAPGHALKAFSTTFGDPPPGDGASGGREDLAVAGDFGSPSLRSVRDTLWTPSAGGCGGRGEPAAAVVLSPSGGEKECVVVRHFLAVSATLVKNLNRPPKWPLGSECFGGGGWKSLTLPKSTEP
ncbi:hypothetical protein EYF80_055343 [Liparis tanakae]|uniref:Uncharacterized protein n=1 Tax=Liparis tanakae TaxID=230148 RepID=A0A4Z2F1G0_9TELE|nr:hypothetical protein EYF80_055343 [Liparis tanakae]